ncbi:MAG: pseudouridine synthase [Pseudomonadota bacterium]|nr:pseudouridine synthase [Pseudomonadota bacterium]
MSTPKIAHNTVVVFNKPFKVLSQFSPHEGKTTLAEFIPIAGIYPAGRLDFDSEGLLLLTGNGPLQQRLTHPRHKLPKTYWAQVEGEISEAALQPLRDGIKLKDGLTLPAQAERMAEPPGLWPRDPPIRHRANIPTSWLALTLHEGRNRQVRRMTAAVGYPTLRLIRWSVGPWTIADLAPGDYRVLTVPDPLLPVKPDNKPQAGTRRAAPRQAAPRRAARSRSKQ